MRSMYGPENPPPNGKRQLVVCMTLSDSDYRSSIFTEKKVMIVSTEDFGIVAVTVSLPQKLSVAMSSAATRPSLGQTLR